MQFVDVDLHDVKVNTLPTFPKKKEKSCTFLVLFCVNKLCLVKHQDKAQINTRINAVPASSCYRVQTVTDHSDFSNN
jgi:hypothetical protein